MLVDALTVTEKSTRRPMRWSEFAAAFHFDFDPDGTEQPMGQLMEREPLACMGRLLIGLNPSAERPVTYRILLTYAFLLQGLCRMVSDHAPFPTSFVPSADEWSSWTANPGDSDFIEAAEAVREYLQRVFGSERWRYSD